MLDPRLKSRFKLLALFLAVIFLILYVILKRQEEHHDDDLKLHFAFEPVERFSLENVKYSWILASVVVVALTFAIS